MGSKFLFLKLFFLLNIILLAAMVVLVNIKVPQEDKVRRHRINLSDPAVGYVSTYGTLKNHLCRGKRKFVVDKDIVIKSDDKNCPKWGIVTFIPGGRTGNQIWEYASAWGVARLVGLDPYIPDCMRWKLKKIFANLTVPDFKKIKHCPVKFDTFIENYEDFSNEKQSIVLRRYILLANPTLRWVKDLMKEFQFKEKYRKAAQKTLLKIVEDLPSDEEYTFIGVHVRRTDYGRYLKRKYNNTFVTPKFFYKAMDYFKQKYFNCLFIFISDDPAWCFRNFGEEPDVFVPAYNKTMNFPALDMAILAACNHSIFDYGTFGEWGALLTGGEVVYLNSTQNILRGISKLMKNWHLLPI